MDPKDQAAPNERAVTTYQVGRHLTDPQAIIAALMASGYEAIAAVASGHLWEDEHIDIKPDRRDHALTMAAIWRRAAETFQLRTART
jgi:hypothetical protein